MWIEPEVCALPVDAPAVAWCGYPNESLLGCPSGMVIEQRRSFIESPGVPGIRESLEVQVVAKLVTQSAKKGSKRGDLLAYRRFHPHTNKNGVRVVIPEKLDGRPFSDTEGPGGENPYAAALHFIEIGCSIKKVSRNPENLFGPSRLHRALDGRSNSSQPIVLGQP